MPRYRRGKKKSTAAVSRPYNVPSSQSQNSTSRNDSDQAEFHCDKYSKVSECTQQCEHCLSWFCTVCSKLSEEVFSVIDGVKNIHWFCDTCDGLVMGYIDKSSGDSVKQVIKSTIYKALDSAVGQFVKTLTETTNSIQQTLKSTTPNDVHMDTSHSVADNLPTENRKVIDAVDEYVDRERRKKNLIIHNLPEPTVGDTDEQRTTGDLQAISGLLDSEFGVSRNQVSKPVRLGAKKSNKPRLLKIEISDVNV